MSNNLPMHILIGYFKGEAFIIGHTGSKARAERFIADYPHGKNDEFDYVERQTSHSL
ncbi:hypothetical protein SEA_MRWORLDWIDE_29 [Microbacterium phage MrWorldwide]|uniref:Uncharacterized protein n=10 Tax=Ilzatvirus teagan TaxID=2845595 RepID=A0A4D6E3A8_9CAUD|nr:hypothetical protein SEA_MILLYPHILLY_29 [Microbacterium phage MillyPhilly]QBZ73137.1 hypothetical protein SEA_TINSULPHUR_30 [Microbacterium phage TinSulphur]QDH47783.1 hypothetical protein SEA_SHEE_29 [Microbacterium phage Shee]QDP44701.1 hypothetical protein STANKTOSSA_29 [Microbacterium phage Stanktossa]QKN87847.1 hypothetical protein SEA_DOTHRAKI_29 [Microbacterium phage Dothraki]QKO02887.1 hypothetical protein SEA_PARLEG_29 [Microbacterium Phage ParleG]QOC56821.1 hypothetical protein S